MRAWVVHRPHGVVHLPAPTPLAPSPAKPQRGQSRMPPAPPMPHSPVLKSTCRKSVSLSGPGVPSELTKTQCTCKTRERPRFGRDFTRGTRCKGQRRRTAELVTGILTRCPSRSAAAASTACSGNAHPPAHLPAPAVARGRGGEGLRGAPSDLCLRLAVAAAQQREAGMARGRGGTHRVDVHATSCPRRLAAGRARYLAAHRGRCGVAAAGAVGAVGEIGIAGGYVAARFIPLNTLTRLRDRRLHAARAPCCRRSPASRRHVHGAQHPSFRRRPCKTPLRHQTAPAQAFGLSNNTTMSITAESVKLKLEQELEASDVVRAMAQPA